MLCNQVLDSTLCIWQLLFVDKFLGGRGGAFLVIFYVSENQPPEDRASINKYVIRVESMFRYVFSTFCIFVWKKHLVLSQKLKFTKIQDGGSKMADAKFAKLMKFLLTRYFWEQLAYICS